MNMSRNKPSQKAGKSKGIVKGTGRAFVVAVLVHIGLFLLAGALVVFTVVRQKDVEFEPPQATERPKMKLKKPKVRVKKNSRPKSTARITSTKANKSAMPTIDLPSMGGLGDELGTGIGGFDIMPDLAETTVFGAGQTIGNDLVGIFYDTKRDRAGRPIPYSQPGFEQIINKFVRSGFKDSALSKYYRSPNKRYTTTIMLPPMLSVAAPYAFNERDTVGCLFLIHYQGQLVHKDGISFRFWGESGDALFVAIDGEVVLNACYPTADMRYYSLWQSDSPDHRKYRMGYREAAVGDLITLEPGVSHKLDIVVGESPGGGFGGMLLVEVEGEEYDKNWEGTPLLPIFKTSALTLDQLDAMYEYLVPNEVLVTNGPTFSDYESVPFNLHALTNLPPLEPEPEPEPADVMRTWTMEDGSSMDAQLVTRVMDRVVFESVRGKQTRVSFDTLSEEDRRFVEFNTPPEFRFDFAKQTSKQPAMDPGPFMAHVPQQRITDYVFTAKIFQSSPGDYPHELTAEFFAIGAEVDGDNFVLLDRQTSVFKMDAENDRKHYFSGPRIEVNDNIDYYGNRRGVKYGGYLITVTDVRGKIIAHGASHEWLMDGIHNLKRVPVGKHFNKAGYRCFPPRQVPRRR